MFARRIKLQPSGTIPPPPLYDNMSHLSHSLSCCNLLLQTVCCPPHSHCPPNCYPHRCSPPRSLASPTPSGLEKENITQISIVKYISPLRHISTCYRTSWYILKLFTSISLHNNLHITIRVNCQNNEINKYQKKLSVITKHRTC